MLSKECFAEAVRVFLAEMSNYCLLETPEGLRHLIGFRREIEERRKLLRDPHATDVTVLSGSFGLVDEYVNRKWDEIIGKIYETYLIEQTAKERSGEQGK